MNFNDGFDFKRNRRNPNVNSVKIYLMMQDNIHLIGENTRIFSIFFYPIVKNSEFSLNNYSKDLKRAVPCPAIFFPPASRQIP